MLVTTNQRSEGEYWIEHISGYPAKLENTSYGWTVAHQCGCIWTVQEATSGIKLCEAKTRKEAIEKANRILRSKTDEQVRGAIKRATQNLIKR